MGTDSSVHRRLLCTERRMGLRGQRSLSPFLADRWKPADEEPTLRGPAGNGTSRLGRSPLRFRSALRVFGPHFRLPLGVVDAPQALQDVSRHAVDAEAGFLQAKVGGRLAKGSRARSFVTSLSARTEMGTDSSVHGRLLCTDRRMGLRGQRSHRSPGCPHRSRIWLSSNPI